MKRVMVNLPDATGEIFERKVTASTPKVSASAYIVGLVEKDLRAAGLIGETPRAEVIAYIEQLGDAEAKKALRDAWRAKAKKAVKSKGRS